MRVLTIWAALALLLTSGTAAASEVIRLTPASPQPDAAKLKPGLAVEYAYPADVKSLAHAQSWLEYGTESGPPLIGFDYPDTLDGEMTLTSRQSVQVIARIDGYIRFDAPGVYALNVHSNDGLRVTIGGQDVSVYDGRHPCESPGAQTVEAPEAGWYPLEALYFQRVGTACLLMEWGPAGSPLGWTPNEVFAHIP